MAIYKHNPKPNPVVRFLRKAYNPLGFHKGYNAALWFIFAGALVGFCLARAQYLDINGIFRKGSSPGEYLYYENTLGKAGITIHLASVVPAGILAALQFTPVIRHRARLFHRINGYIVILLVLLAIISALMIARHAFGGTLPTQAYVGALAILSLISVTLAYVNIKRLQIEQHRAWMLRLWAYMGSIITLRIIMIIAAMITSQLGGYYLAVSCEQIEYAEPGASAMYVACEADPKGWTAVMINMVDPKSVAGVMAALQGNFGMAAWLALTLHALGVELYLKLTPAEGERLRNLSYERQMERGFAHPGRAGITVDKCGDAEEWTPTRPTVTKTISESSG